MIDIDLLSVVDSTKINSGRFLFKGNVSKPTSYWIKCENSYSILQVENVLMHFSSSLRNMKMDYISTGGAEQALQTDLNNLVRPFEKIYTPAYDSLVKKLYVDSVHHKKLIKTFNDANDRYMRNYINFGKKHVNSYIGLDIVYKNRKSIPIDSLVLLYNKLNTTLQKTDRGLGLKTYTQENIAKKGNHFFDFEVIDLHGKLFKLSTLKNKFIYLTFGSFGCAPCRMENAYIAKNYKLLSQKLEIVNFSLDINKKEWMAAAKIDGIIWHNVSDMAGIAGRIKTIYDVQSMPTSFLIDKNGIIIEKFEGYNPDNFNYIESVISKR